MNLVSSTWSLRCSKIISLSETTVSSELPQRNKREIQRCHNLSMSYVKVLKCEDSENSEELKIQRERLFFAAVPSIDRVFHCVVNGHLDLFKDATVSFIDITVASVRTYA